MKKFKMVTYLSRENIQYELRLQKRFVIDCGLITFHCRRRYTFIIAHFPKYAVLNQRRLQFMCQDQYTHIFVNVMLRLVPL